MIEFGLASAEDVGDIVRLLREDSLGREREGAGLADYRAAFEELTADQNCMVVVGRLEGHIVASLELTLIPSLTHGGTKRAQMEGVRVDPIVRGRGYGSQPVLWAIDLAESRGCGLVQLTTDRKRGDTTEFYGMKLWL